MQQGDPGEAINERHLSSMDHDEAVVNTLRDHALTQQHGVERVGPSPPLGVLEDHCTGVGELVETWPGPGPESSGLGRSIRSTLRPPRPNPQ